VRRGCVAVAAALAGLMVSSAGASADIPPPHEHHVSFFSYSAAFCGYGQDGSPIYVDVTVWVRKDSPAEIDVRNPCSGADGEADLDLTTSTTTVYGIVDPGSYWVGSGALAKLGLHKLRLTGGGGVGWGPGPPVVPISFTLAPSKHGR